VLKPVIQNKWFFLLTSPAFIFLFLYVFMYIFSIIPSDSENVIKLRDHISIYGVIFHFITAAAFLLGAHAAMYNYHFYGTRKKFYVAKRRLFSNLIYFYCIVGIGVVLWQISASISLTDYLRELVTYIKVQDDSNAIRKYFLRTRETGGLPGIIKMFSYLPLSALYMVLARESIRNRFDDTKGILISSGAKRYISVILITILIRSLFTLDRVLIGSVFIITIYYFVFNIRRCGKIIGHSKKRLFFLFAILVSTATFLHVISLIRQARSFKDVLAQYSSLGLANLSILFESNFDHTLGRNLFYVVRFPLEYIGLADALFTPDKAAWVWNPARYLTAYAYQDFGIFCILFFFVFGFFTTVIHLKAWYKSNPYILVALFALIFIIATCIVVPIFRGPEWWVSLLMAMFGVKLTCAKTSIKNDQSGESALVVCQHC